jgi:hypothetical protein
LFFMDAMASVNTFGNAGLYSVTIRFFEAANGSRV